MTPRQTPHPHGRIAGAVYLRARHYQPALGRFLQRDTFPGIPERPQSLHKYLYAENNPATFSDPSGQCVPVLLAVWAIAEVAIQIYDTYDTLNTIFDPCISLWEKGFVATLYVGGLFLPGGGYGTGGRAVLNHTDDASRFVRWGDEAADGARLLDHGDDLARHSDAAEQIRVTDDVAKCFNSFSADTPVATAAGQVGISAIDVGDRVLAYHEGLRTTGLYTVTAVISHVDPGFVVLWLGGERLETTAEHPFLVLGRGWVEVEDLIVGDMVRQRDGGYAPVESLALVRRARRMYNLTVAGAHTFFVGEQGWLVHNTGCLTIVGDASQYSASERRAAQYMADQGHDVVLRPPTGRAGGGTSDLVVNGVTHDVYTPTTGNPDRIVSAIRSKNSQVAGIVLDLSNSTVDPSDLGNILQRVRNAGGTNIQDIVIIK